MQPISYGKWVREYEEGKYHWYPENNVEFLGDKTVAGLDLYVNGREKAHFRLLLDPKEPWELEVWDTKQERYRPCAVCYSNTIWELMINCKIN